MARLMIATKGGLNIDYLLNIPISELGEWVKVVNRVQKEINDSKEP